jgi:hypothetical protein
MAFPDADNIGSALFSHLLANDVLRKRAQLDLDLSAGGVDLSAEVDGNGDPAGRWQYGVLRFHGALTANREVIVPTEARWWWVVNDTTGAYTVTLKTPGAGTGIAVAQGKTAPLRCDGTNVVRLGPDYP